jgi:DNA-binding PadR family transcriptional regulator
MEQRIPATENQPLRSRFELAPPRRFLLPAILLLLSERPSYGYGLVKDVRDFGFGRVDRPAVYRALAQLEADRLVIRWTETPTAGQARRVYALTADGVRALRAWMGVIKEERSCLDHVLRRYRATGSGDAVLAEVEDALASMLGPGWSPVSPSASPTRTLTGRLTTVRRHPPPDDPAAERGPAPDAEGRGDRGRADADGSGRPCDGAHPAERFALVPDRSAVLIEARSTVGPITFGALGLTGSVEAGLHGGAVCTATPASAHIELAIEGLRSGNSLYDAELLRRIGARRYPVVDMELRESSDVGRDGLYRLGGDIAFHGVTRAMQGLARVLVGEDGSLEVTGEQVVDIRDFGVASPTVLMLRIYPDVRVRLHVEAQPEDQGR